MQTFTELEFIQSKLPKYMVALFFTYMSPVLKKGNKDTQKSEGIIV